jgi:hypothetical protein
MSVRKTIEQKFGGRRMFRKAPTPHIQVVASGTGTTTQKGVFIYSSSSDAVYLTVNTVGTSHLVF